MTARIVVAMPADWPAEAPVTAGPLIILPDDIQAWIERTLRRDAPAGPMRVVDDRELTTDTGFPMRVVTAGFGDDGAVCRVAAFYAFLEHGGAVRVELGAALLAARGEELTRALAGARPDFSTEIAGLHDLLPMRAPSGETRAELLLDNGHAEEALAALGDERGDSPHAATLRGEALVALGRVDEALAAWDRAAELDPGAATALYNAAQARSGRGDLAGALAGWRRVADLLPDDLLVQRKILRAELALGLAAEADATREGLRRRWAETEDPRGRLLDELLIDELDAGPLHVQVYQSAPSDEPYRTLYTFRAILREEDRDLPIRVLVETSAYARERGTPYVLAVEVEGRYRALGAAAELPPWKELCAAAVRIIEEELGGERET